MTSPSGRYRLGFDIGGTFTDFVLLDAATGGITLFKCLTTPADPAEGALTGIRAITAQAGIAVADLSEVVHGTTLVTNALIERRGATTGLLTTRGFRDVLELGIEQRYDIYDLFLKFPDPIVPRRRRIEITERVTHDGQTIAPLDAAEVRAAGAKLVAEGCTAIAICFLHAYANPAHERAAAAVLREAFPQLAISLSSEVAPEIREYERSVTTCANAFVQPLMDRYVGKLLRELDALGFAGTLRLMQSDGGLCAPEVARALPIRLLESGPAGGALATVLFARAAGLPDALAFDMGGTTAKACLIEHGRAEVAPEIREFERSVTTCANAFVQPLMDRYLGKLLHEFDALGFTGTLRLMQSDGGLCAPEVARALPIRLLESGPAGGALATVLFARAAGLPDALAFDMGGTTAKACLIEHGRAEVAPMMEAARVHRFKRGSGLPIRAPVVDMIEIGAGGGSIAGVDETGLIKVGPHSAGAD
ncbi:MAG TPA: hydantoinase/oxoprolinase family protein, partial [Roseomonas sp.]|nr:hydantoinase/oxoprolinase family protein [Roseomonas sp.]